MGVPALLAALSTLLVPCGVPGEWPHTRDAAWTVKVLRTAGYGSNGCTGSALVVDLGGPGRTGHDLYVWAFTARRLAIEPGMHTVRVTGVRIHVDGLRAVWRAGRRNVWIEAGPTTRRLPRVARWRALVAASVVTPG